jgi:hypothetical protein
MVARSRNPADRRHSSVDWRLPLGLILGLAGVPFGGVTAAAGAVCIVSWWLDPRRSHDVAIRLFGLASLLGCLFVWSMWFLFLVIPTTGATLGKLREDGVTGDFDKLALGGAALGIAQLAAALVAWWAWRPRRRGTEVASERMPRGR